MDGDFVELHNLQRQQLFTEQDADDHRAKVKAAAERLRQINSSVLIHEAFAELSAANIDEYVQNVDVIVDATDNFATRMLINDAARKNGVPWVYGGVSGSYGVSMLSTLTSLRVFAVYLLILEKMRIVTRTGC